LQVKRIVVSTYQAASGAGAAAMAELELQTREVLDGKPPTTEIFDQQVRLALLFLFLIFAVFLILCGFVRLLQWRG
jgi:aspartate-semialdehyde dehydrogenase